MPQEVFDFIAEDCHEPIVEISILALEFKRGDLFHHDEEDVVDQFFGIELWNLEDVHGLPDQSIVIHIDQMDTAQPMSLFEFLHDLSVGDPRHAPHGG